MEMCKYVKYLYQDCLYDVIKHIFSPGILRIYHEEQCLCQSTPPKAKIGRYRVAFFSIIIINWLQHGLLLAVLIFVVMSNRIPCTLSYTFLDKSIIFVLIHIAIILWSVGTNFYCTVMYQLLTFNLHIHALHSD